MSLICFSPLDVRMILLLTAVSSCWGFNFFNFIEKSLNTERCNSNWIKNDVEGLRTDLKEKVFGQPLVETALLPSLSFFLENVNPSKPFVISLHGSPGTGKTMVSQLIAANMFYKGSKSRFYKHYTMADVHNMKQINLVDDVIERARYCERNLFVFDEIEKMPSGTFETLKPFLDFHHHISGIDFRKNIFIFISNIGMNKINSITRDLWYKGTKREDIKLSSFYLSLFKSALNEEGGLKGTGVVKNYLVDLYIPFLPLEKEHVEKCIKHILPNISSAKIKKIIDELVFEPQDAPLFSLSGCKSLESLIRIHDEL